MVNPKEKAQLQEMWNKSEVAGQDIPDGTYQFVIVSARFHMSDKGRPQFKTKVRIKGGAEEYIGKEMEINDNLETPENQGWFKKKLARLNIAAPEDFEEVCDGTLAEQMTGKVFEGQAKTKNDFLNVYVNRLLGEQKAEEAEQAPEESVEEATEDVGAFEEGQSVTWNGKKGEVIELQDDGKYRVKAGDGKIYRVAKELLTITEEREEEAPEESAEEATTLPSPEEADGLPAAEVKKVLKDLGIEAGKVKNPRAVLHGIATLAEDPQAKPELTEIAPLCEALGVRAVKNDIKATVKSLSKAVQGLLN